MKDLMQTDHIIINSDDGKDYLVMLDKEKLKDIETGELYTILMDVLDGRASFTGSKLEKKYIGPRKGGTTPENTKLNSILQTINPQLKDVILSIEPYIPYQEGDTFDEMTKEVSPLKDVIDYNLNIPEQDLDPEYLENRTFREVKSDGEIVETTIKEFGIELITKINATHGLALNAKKIEYFVNLFNTKYQRIPTFSELHMFAQINSEHCRHNIFNGVLTVDKEEYKKSMFEFIKETYKNNPGDVVVAYDDNGAILKAQNGRYLVIKCETHNHPSLIEPFAGGATGSGGTYRDIMATGRGAEVEISTSAYCFGNVLLDNPYNKSHKTPLEVLIKSVRGVNYYGNCFAAPMINGSITAQITDFKVGDKNIGFAKPVIMAGSAGSMPEAPLEQLTKNHEKGLIHIKLGGADYRIGVGGAAASSLNAGENKAKLDFASVQRPDPQMQTKMKNVIENILRECPEAIQNIHDYGAGGHGTNIFELAEGDDRYAGGVDVDIAQITVHDKSMKYHEIMINESQERMGLLIKPEYLEQVQAICAREKCPIDVLGQSTDTGKVHIHDSRTGKDIVNVDVEDFILKEREYFEDVLPHYDLKPLDIARILKEVKFADILKHPTVGSKAWLVNHVDRSVRGKIVQQQTVGKRQLPIADYALFKLQHDDLGGTVTGQGQRPFNTIISPEKMVQYSLTEAIFNTSFVKHRGLDKLALSGNWMRSAKTAGGKAELRQAVVALSKYVKQLSPNIPVGKDSLSMQVVDDDGNKIDAPGTVELSAFVQADDVSKRVTPELKNEDSVLIYLPVKTTDKKTLYHRLIDGLNGSIAAQFIGEFGDTLPDIDMNSVKDIHNFVQDLIESDMVLAGHDVSEGGLYTTISEMYMAGETDSMDFNVGEGSFPHPGKGKRGKKDMHFDDALLRSELPGIVLQIDKSKLATIKKLLPEDLEMLQIGYTKKDDTRSKAMNLGIGPDLHHHHKEHLLQHRNHTTNFVESKNKEEILKEAVRLGKDMSKIDKVDTNADTSYLLPDFSVNRKRSDINILIQDNTNKKVGVLRDEGTNGQHDMRYIWKALGAKVTDIHITDLISGKYILDDFDIITGPGGFSYGDMPRSGKGVASVVEHNPILKPQFDDFATNNKKGSLRICNGNQRQQEMGYITRSYGLEGKYPMQHNYSGQFESRPNAVKIINDDNIWLHGMKGEIRGIWSAHGEGLYPDKLFEDLEAKGIAFEDAVPFVFVDQYGNPTEKYPANPNGSKGGAAGLISANGKHFTAMPHPERSVRDYQFPYTPDKEYDYTRSQIFENALKNI